MDTELILKWVTAFVAVLGAILTAAHFWATRRSLGFQNSKTIAEILTQNIAAADTDPAHREFLLNVRKEQISFLIFGFSMPAADLDKAIEYYKNAEGKVTTNEIAIAWSDRVSKAKRLSFRLSVLATCEYWFFLVFLLVCYFSVFVCLLVLIFFHLKQVIPLMCVCGFGVVVAALNRRIFVARRLSTFEKERAHPLKKSKSV